MINYFFRKRERLSYQSGNSLSHCAVKTLYRICFSTFFSHRTVPFGRKDFFICRPKICIGNSALSVNCRQRVPKLLCPFTITTADIHSDNLFRINIFCQPYPHLIFLAFYKRPHLITFNCQPSLLLFRDYYHFRYILIFIVHIILQPSFRNPGNSSDPSQRNFFQKEKIDKIFRLLRYYYIFRIFNELPITVSTHKFLFFRGIASIFDDIFRITIWAVHNAEYLLLGFTL